MTEKELDTLKEKLRRLVVDDIGAAIQALKEALPEGAPKEDTVLSLEGRLNDANRSRLRGVISNEELQRSYNQLRASLLELITGLEPGDFKAPGEGPVIPEGKTGHILYQVPRRMQLERETKCIVRLAYEEESIIRNIELTEDTKLQSLRISQVMHVALVDPNPEETFRIRTLSGEEQFVERGDYTEWIFFVTPLREGTFPLVLRVSVIELILGKERKKDIVLEESIQITTAVVETDTSEFKSAGYALTASEEAPVSGGEIPKMEPPPAPQAGAARQKSAPSGRETEAAPRAGRSFLRPLAAAASILLLATVALTIWAPGVGNREGPSEHVAEPAPGSADPSEDGEVSLHFEVRLLVPSHLQDTKIWVDDRQVEPQEEQDGVKILRLERKTVPYHFELRLDGEVLCQDVRTIERDGQLVELDCQAGD
jgi:hypothetical protein